QHCYPFVSHVILSRSNKARAAGASGGSRNRLRPPRQAPTVVSVRPMIRTSNGSDAWRTYTTSSATLSGSRRSTYAVSGSPAASTMSSRRFAMAARPADGEEHLRRFQAGLVAPRPGAVAERLERAGVWIRPDLALVARHGGDLGLERLGDIHPRVGHKAARVGPFGAARGIERIDCANA